MQVVSRRRYISTDISIDKSVNRMGMEYGDGPVLLYTWMIPHALDDATMTGDPYEILNMVFPGRRDKTEHDITEALNAMVKYGLIEWADAKVLFHPESFYKYQTYIKKENRRTAENTEKHRESPNINDVQQTSAQNTVSLSPSPSLSHSKDSGGVAQEKVLIQQHFQNTWGRFPNDVQLDNLAHYTQNGMEVELVFAALDKARLNDKDVGYAIGILEKQHDRSIRTVAQAEIDDAKYQAAIGGERSDKRQRNSGTDRTNCQSAERKRIFNATGEY